MRQVSTETLDDTCSEQTFLIKASSMTENNAVNLSDIIGRIGKYQILLWLSCFYSFWFIGTAVVTVELLAPLVTVYWDWDADNPNRTTFVSNDCLMEDILELNRTSNLSSSHSRLIYTSQYSSRTLTEDLDLICERSWIVSFSNFMCMIGLSAGNLLLSLSEKYGRRRLLILAGLVSVVVSITLTFTRGFVMLAISSLVFRAASNQVAMLLYLQTMEAATQTLAPYVGVFSQSGLLIGQTILTCAAWILRDWFHLQLFQTSLAAVLPFIVWYVLESPVWLAVRGKYSEARDVLEKIVKRNGRKLEEVEPNINKWMEQMKVRCEIETTAEKGKLKDLFKNKRISLVICGLTFTTMSQAFIYTGLSMNAESFGSGLYVDLTLSNTLSLVPVFITALLIKNVSTRVLLIWLYIFEGLSSIAYPIACSFPIARTITAVLGRMFVSPIFSLTLVYTYQVLPTSVRGVSNGFIRLSSFVLASVCPFTKELGEVSSMYVPFIIFAVLSLASAAVYSLMPETKGKPLIHTVEEMKNFTRR